MTILVSLVRPVVARLAVALLTAAPMAACAQPAGQAANPPASPPDHQSGQTLDQFVQRGEARQLAADSDGDGRVGKAEFLAAARTGPGAGRGDPATRFARIDRNGDGFLDKSEIDAQLAERFHRLDANGDGLLTRQERAAARGGGDGAAQRGPNGA